MAYIRTGNSSFGKLRCNTLYITSMLLRANNCNMYLFDLVKLESSLSTTNSVCLQMFSFTTMMPPGFSPALHLSKNATASSAAWLHNVYECIKVQLCTDCKTHVNCQCTVHTVDDRHAADALKETHHLLNIAEPIESILHHTCIAIVSYFNTTDQQCIRDTNQPYN